MPIYEPREKGSNTKYIIIPIVIICMLVAFFGVRYVIKKETKSTAFSVCSYDTETLQEKIKTSYKNKYSFSDYLYYGESIYLTVKNYDPEKTDAISGRTIILKDMCSDNEYAFVVGSTVDRGITLNNIKPGFYEVYVVEDLIEKRATYKQTLDTNINTIHRDNKTYNARLLANANLFKDSDIIMDDNYLYLSVTTNDDDSDYDIVLDPSGMDYDFSYELNEGDSGNGVSENAASYKACTMLKERLEKQGLKVLITKESADEIVNSYGDDGRLERAYTSGAKYYIRINFVLEDTYNYEGMDVTYSSHSSNQFASQIIYRIEHDTKMNVNGLATDGDGLFASYLLTGDDGRAVYDTDLWVREAGGKATQAGKYSDNASSGDGSFAKDNVYGMNAIDITLGYLNSTDDTSYWKNNKEKYMDKLSQAICEYLNVGEE